eukprot:SAG31_NODE_662_length_13028_cov_3.364529_12_plen_163_part_00
MAAISAALALLIGGGVGTAASAGVVEIGGAKQLLVDDSLLQSVRGAAFQMHPPQLHDLGKTPLMRPDSQWELRDEMHLSLYSSVLPKRGGPAGFRVWYYLLSEAFDSKAQPDLAEQNGVVAYAEISVSEVTFSFLCNVFEKYGTLIERNSALIEKVSPCRKI